MPRIPENVPGSITLVMCVGMKRITQGTLYFAVEGQPDKRIQDEDTVYLYGELSGPWMIERKIREQGEYAIIRIRQSRQFLTTDLAVPLGFEDLSESAAYYRPEEDDVLVKVPCEHHFQHTAHEETLSLHPLRYASPYKAKVHMPSPDQTYTEDYSQPPVKVRIDTRLEGRKMLVYAVTSTPRIIITQQDTLHTTGELKGRWRIEGKLCALKRCDLVCIREMYEHIITVIAVPRGSSKLPDPGAQTQEYYQSLVDLDCPIDVVQLLQDTAEDQFAPPTTHVATWINATAPAPPAPPAVSGFSTWQLLQWEETETPATYQKRWRTKRPNVDSFL
ncbi:hypothetical protein C8R47DRAFT_1071938 [Mycena vitilis]|nr:hypothetical protein C8R47DRAFT_1071938 [Mycena vitilis]